jgi:hypothetical protein
VLAGKEVVVVLTVDVVFDGVAEVVAAQPASISNAMLLAPSV